MDKDRIYNIVKQFGAKKEKDYISIEFPIALHLWECLLEFRIYEYEDHYEICLDGDVFYRHNNNPNYYLDIFFKVRPEYKYLNIYLKNVKSAYYIDGRLEYIPQDAITASFPNNCNPNMALNDMIKFMIALDDYLYENNLW